MTFAYFGHFLSKFQLTVSDVAIVLSNGHSEEVITVEPHLDEMVYMVVADYMVGAKDYESNYEDFDYFP